MNVNEVVIVHTMKAYGANEGTSPLILNFGTNRKCVVELHVSVALPATEISLCVFLNRSLNGRQS
jgi:hypothetical protein